MRRSVTPYVMAGLLMALHSAAEDTPADKTADEVTSPTRILELDTTSVTGNRELPKVLVIVPWKNPELAELTGRPLASLVEEALSPIDPDVFRRQVDYYNGLQGNGLQGNGLQGNGLQGNGLKGKGRNSGALDNATDAADAAPDTATQSKDR